MFLYNTDVLSQDTAATTAPIPVTTALPTTTSATTVTPTTESANTVTQSTDSATTDNPTLPSGTCGGPGWRRVAFINMTDPNQDCPQGLSLTDYSIRLCGRAHTGIFDCSSVTFPVDSEYSQVCGRAMAYRWGQNAGFYGYHVLGHNIERQYMDGLSLTHGTPRTHIWTFASGLFNGTSGDSSSQQRCPCDPGNTNGSPSFVGNDYFCDSVATADNWNVNHPRFFPDNALWDGQNHLNTCYELNNPPWFYKTLPVTTTDDIELRMCFADGSGLANIGINLLEVYIY